MSGPPPVFTGRGPHPVPYWDFLLDKIAVQGLAIAYR